MKNYAAFFALIVLALFSACAPAPAAAVPGTPVPAGTDATVAATLTETIAPTDTPIPTDTETPTVTPTSTITPTRTPAPTRKSPYPVGPETPLPDVGFPEIGIDTLEKLKPVFRLINQDIWHSAASRDGKKLFAATSDGMFVYDRQGKQLASWPAIIMYYLPCGSCLSVDLTGNRFAMVTRKDGKWDVQVYDVDGEKVALAFEQPLEGAFRGVADEVHLALSPDGILLAYDGPNGTLVLDLGSKQQVFSRKGFTDAVVFTPDGVSLAIRSGRELLFWKTATWKNPANLLLPAEDTPYAFSPDGKLIGIAVFAKVRVYNLDTLAPTREITVVPTSATDRVWQLTFKDEKTLLGYGIRWDGSHTKATVDVGEWNMETGDTLKLETSETDAPPDALSTLWGASIPATSPRGDIETGQYQRFAFVTQESFLVASLHTVCWLKLSTGEKTCFNDPKNNVIASDTGAYREILQDHNTLLQNWNGGNAFDITPPYRILVVSKSADYIVVNVNDATTDLYFKSKRGPVESLPGTFQAYAEYGTQMALATNKAGLGYVALVDRESLKTLFRKQDRLFLKPMTIDRKGSVYMLRRDPGRPEVTLQVIAAPGYNVADVARLSVSAEPQVMALAATTGLFAFGMQDGSVQLVSPDGTQSATFQAAYSPVSAVSFSIDGRYLAVGSTEGIKIYAVLP